MKRFIGGLAAAVLIVSAAVPARADGSKDAAAILDKAIKALGGAEKFGKTPAYQLKGKGTINFGGNESSFTAQATAQGLDHYRSEFEADLGGNKIHGVTVINGTKGWRKFGENGMDLSGDVLANEKRNVYLQVLPISLVALKGEGFKLALAGEEKVGDKPAVGLKVTGPEGKDFTIYFDKASGLPVKQVAKVSGFMGEEVTQETTYADYKDFGGVKKATKTTSKRDGEPFLKQEITEFKLLDKVAPETFAEPK